MYRRAVNRRRRAPTIPRTELRCDRNRIRRRNSRRFRGGRRPPRRANARLAFGRHAYIAVLTVRRTRRQRSRVGAVDLWCCCPKVSPEGVPATRVARRWGLDRNTSTGTSNEGTRTPPTRTGRRLSRNSRYPVNGIQIIQWNN